MAKNDDCMTNVIPVTNFNGACYIRLMLTTKSCTKARLPGNNASHLKARTIVTVTIIDPLHLLCFNVSLFHYHTSINFFSLFKRINYEIISIDCNNI